MRKIFVAMLLAGAAMSARAQETTPAMVAAAEKEGKVVWYASVDVKVAEEVAKAFKEQYPKIEVEVERAGSERVLQRINQEYGSGIHNVDLVNSSDASHFLFWKQQKWGYKDLLEPKWKGKLTKAHPGYSGTALTGTYALTKVLGWEYLEKLAQQNVQQLQSTTATPKSIASGERAVMVDGNEYNMFIEIQKKSPVKIVYALEGTPFISSPVAIFAQAPHPSAARVFENFIYTPKVQQLLVDVGGQRSLHPDVKEPDGRTPLTQIKLLPDDPAGMMPLVADIKKRYTAIFGN